MQPPNIVKGIKNYTTDPSFFFDSALKAAANELHEADLSGTWSNKINACLQ